MLNLFIYWLAHFRRAGGHRVLRHPEQYVVTFLRFEEGLDAEQRNDHNILENSPLAFRSSLQYWTPSWAGSTGHEVVSNLMRMVRVEGLQWAKTAIMYDDATTLEWVLAKGLSVSAPISERKRVKPSESDSL